MAETTACGGLPSWLRFCESTGNTQFRNSGGNMLKKLSMLILILASLCTGLFAVPGINPLVPDASGQYVYYRDYSFMDETYIGILRYDEGTYALRFCSCKNDKLLKDITIYVTMNTSVDYVDLTGERISGTVGTDDVEILNYLHDFLYEFASRRKKQNSKDFSDSVIVYDDYPQFGGSVRIEYDFYIPIFNIAEIQAEDGTCRLEAVCTGILTSNNDKAFSEFKGIKHADISEVRVSSDDIPAEEWIQQDNNLWTLGDNAIYATNYLACDEADFLAKNGFSFLQYYACTFLSSTDYYYVLLDDADILIDTDSLFFAYETFDLETGANQKTMKHFSKIDSSLFEESDEKYTYYMLSEIIAEPDFYSEYEDYLLSVITAE